MASADMGFILKSKVDEVVDCISFLAVLRFDDQAFTSNIKDCVAPIPDWKKLDAVQDVLP